MSDPTPLTPAQAGIEVAGHTTAPAEVRELQIIGVRHGAFSAVDGGDTSGFGGLVAPIVMPGPSEPPYGGWFDDMSEEMSLALADRGVPCCRSCARIGTGSGCRACDRRDLRS